MPASMIRPVTGSRDSVSGSSTATPVVEPRPGSTPMTVPTSTPMKHHSRVSTLSAVEKPRTRLSSMSATDPEKSGRQRHPEEPDEDGVHGGDRQERHDQRRDPGAPLHHGGDEHGEDEEGAQETEERDEQDRDDQGDGHGHQLAAALLGRSPEDVDVVRARSGAGDVGGSVVRGRLGVVPGGDTPRGGALRGGTSPGGVRHGGGDDLRQSAVVRRPLTAHRGDQLPAGDEHDQAADDTGHESGSDARILEEESVVESHDEGAEAEGGEQAVDDDLLDRDAPPGRGSGHPSRTFFRSALLPFRYSTKSSPAAVLACR